MVQYHSEIEAELTQSLKVKTALLESKSVISSISNAADIFIEALANGGKVIFAGNGGSAADAQHLAAELVSKYNFDRPGLPSLSLSTDTSMITAIANDYGYEKLFSRQIEAHGTAQDVFVCNLNIGQFCERYQSCRSCKIYRH
jgi:D-sedoheptulose 7-phosphate isomerase